MPCLDNGPSYGSEGDGVAVKLLCRVMRALKLMGTGHARAVLLDRYPELKVFVREHEREDRRRIAQRKRTLVEKRQRRAALKKLTPAERELLGVRR